MRITGRSAISLALTLIAGCGGGSGVGGGGGGFAGGFVQRSIDLPANDLVYDPVSKRIYASIPSSGGLINGNTIAVIDPVRAAVEKSLFIGSEPNQLALSDDGQFLYVALDGIAAIRRVTLSTFTPDLQFRIEVGGEPLATELAALPGHPHSIAVAMEGGFGDHWGQRIAVFDDGVPRPNLNESPYSGAVWQSLVCSPDGSTIFAYRQDGGSAALLTLMLDASGLNQVGATPGPFSYWDGGLQLHFGRIFSYAGHVIEAGSLTSLAALPVTMNNGTAKPPPGFTVDEARQSARYFHVTPGGVTTPSVAMETFDTQSFAMTSQLALPLPEFVPPSEVKLSRPVQWGSGTAAFAVSNDPNFPPAAKIVHKIILLSNLPR